MHYSSRHRHFVAFPVFVLAIAAIISFDALLPVRATLSEVRETRMVTTQDDRTFSTPSGVAGIVAPSSSVTFLQDGRMFRLSQGSLFLTSPSFISVDAGLGLMAHAFHGSLFALKDSQSSTIVALTTPVTVYTQSGIVVLPPGYQARIDSSKTLLRSRVPASWLQEQKARNALVPLPTVPALSSAQQRLILSCAFKDPSCFSSVHLDDRLVFLVTMVDSSKPLTSPLTSLMLSIADSSGEPALRVLIALQLSLQADRLDETSSEVVSTAFTLPDEELSFLVPALAASSLRPLPSPLLSSWVQASLRSASYHPASIISVFSTLIPTLPQMYEDAGYPKQTLLWRSAIHQVSTVLNSLLTGSDRQVVSSNTKQALREAPIAKAGDLDPTIVDVPVSSVLTESELIAFTQGFLLDAGVLLTAATSIVSDDSLPDCAKVDGVFLSQDNRDVPYVFSYCPVTNVVTAIEKDGMRLPNSVPANLFK